MSLVPVIMRLCARLAGEVSQSRVELFTQSSYFFFQLIQVFLIQTFTNAASTALVQIAQQPGQVFNILSTALPTASNFYISYFIVQGLTIATSVVTQVVGFFVFTLLYKLLAKTPRAMYKKWTSLSALSWGSLLPVYTNIAVISMSHDASTLDACANSSRRHHIFSHCSPDSVLVNYYYGLVLPCLPL